MAESLMIRNSVSVSNSILSFFYVYNEINEHNIFGKKMAAATWEI